MDQTLKRIEDDFLERIKRETGRSEFWQARYAEVGQTTTKHPVTIKDLEHLFPTVALKNRYTKAHYVVRKLHRQGKLKRIGEVQLNGCGRREDVYFNGKLKIDNLLHAVMETKIVRGFGWPSCNRFGDVGPLLTDVEIFMAGKKFNIEADTGEMSRIQVEKRWEKFREAGESFYVVTRYEDRLEDLLRWSAPVKDLAYFALLSDVQRDAFGDIWAVVGDDSLYAIEV